MKNQKYNFWVIIGILCCLVIAVILFPVASDNVDVYKAILYTSIGVVIVLMGYLVKIHIFTAPQKK